MKKTAALSLGALVALFLAQGSQAAPIKADQNMIDSYANGLGADSISQVSSVSELSDVDPNGFAFQALKSLVERYGCIEGYPSKVFLGTKALTRYEFAAGLNACLEKVNELIAAGVADKVSKDDLASLQRLQEEFKAELATLRGRVDSLEAKTKELESQQFSTTTKLDGSVVFNVVGAGSSGTIFTNPFSAQAASGATSVSGSAANTTFTGRTTLNLRTSFTGKDQLRIRLRGFTGEDASGTFSAGTGVGTLFTSGSGNPTNGLSTVNIDKVYYTTPLFADNFRIWVGPNLQGIDIIDGNSFAGGNDNETFSTVQNSYNPLISGIVHSGPGAAFDWSLNDVVSLRGLYMAATGGQSFGAGGITGGTTKGVAELEIRPTKTTALRFQYARINVQNNGGFSTIFGGGTNAVLVGTNPTFAYLGSAAVNAQTDAFGINGEWAVSPTVGFFGRYGFGTTSLTGLSSVTTNTYHVGVSFADAFATGNLLGLAYGQPIRVTGSSRGADSGTETNIEAFYNIKVNDRISITPTVLFFFSPGNVSGNPTTTVGVLRTSFSF